VKSSEGTNEYDDESEIDQSFNFKRIYKNDSNEKKIRFYGLETIPKVGILFQTDQKV
jgi:hypothetical protein